MERRSITLLVLVLTLLLLLSVAEGRPFDSWLQQDGYFRGESSHQPRPLVQTMANHAERCEFFNYEFGKRSAGGQRPNMHDYESGRLPHDDNGERRDMV